MKLQVVFDDIHKNEMNHGCYTSHVINQKPQGMDYIHYHNEYEIYILVSGKRKWFFSDHLCVLSPGDVMIIKPNELHRAIVASDEPYERYVLHVSSALIDHIIKYNRCLGDVLKENCVSLKPEVLSKVIDLTNRLSADIKINSKLAECSVKNYLERLLIVLSEKENISDNKVTFEKSDMRLQTVLDHIAANYNKEITIMECADISYMSKSNFIRVFHSVIGMNFKAYINLLRVDKACELLSGTEMSISDISDETGFDSLSYFCSVFKSIIGVTPKDYRREKSPVSEDADKKITKK